MISREKKIKKISWSKIGSYAVLITLALLYLGPLFMLVNTSLKTMPSFSKDATSLATELKFENFSEAWTKANFPKYLLNSIL
jgi:ABC-type glycerol-3-phosphate transport system permease component